MARYLHERILRRRKMGSRLLANKRCRSKEICRYYPIEDLEIRLEAEAAEKETLKKEEAAAKAAAKKAAKPKAAPKFGSKGKGKGKLADGVHR